MYVYDATIVSQMVKNVLACLNEKVQNPSARESLLLQFWLAKT